MLVEGVFSETPAPIAPIVPPATPRGAPAAAAAAPAHTAPAASEDGQGPLSDLSPSQARLIRAKAAYAGYLDDAAILAQFPGLGKETINEVLRELSGTAQ
jgi:hypothetical protein